MFENNPILKEAYEEGNLYVKDKTIECWANTYAKAIKMFKILKDSYPRYDIEVIWYEFPKKVRDFFNIKENFTEEEIDALNNDNFYDNYADECTLKYSYYSRNI